jgi:hypothetical protein
MGDCPWPTPAALCAQEARICGQADRHSLTLCAAGRQRKVFVFCRAAGVTSTLPMEAIHALAAAEQGQFGPAFERWLAELRLQGRLPSDTDKRGRTVLHWAAYHGNVNAIRLLRNTGVGADARDGQGRCPLHLAALRGQVAAARALVMELGAGVNARDGQGKTPFQLAVESGRGKVAAELAACGADCTALEGYPAERLDRLANPGACRCFNAKRCAGKCYTFLLLALRGCKLSRA